MKLIGYHGTDKQSANLIDQEGFYDSNEDAWLGAGVYFFEDIVPFCRGKEEAEWWVKEYKKFDYWVIYRVDIESELILDLVENFDDKRKYRILWKRLLEKHIQAGLDPKDFSCHDVIVQIRKKIEVIRCFVDAQKPIGEFNSYIIGHPQIQICVYNNSTKVINNILRVEEN